MGRKTPNKQTTYYPFIYCAETPNITVTGAVMEYSLAVLYSDHYGRSAFRLVTGILILPLSQQIFKQTNRDQLFNTISCTQSTIDHEY